MKHTCTLTVNIPFVTGRCDFYGRALRRNASPGCKHAYLDALLAEARWSCPDIASNGLEIDRISFYNGSLGTVEPGHLRSFLHELACVAPLAPARHLDAEVDPGLVSTALLGELRQQGLDLLRFHYLTSDPVESERMERPCSTVEMPKTRIVTDAAGFHTFDMQVLVGLAGQTEKSLLKTLRDAVLTDGVVHCTLIAASGPLALKDPVLVLRLYETADWFLAEHGFAPYTPRCFAAHGHRIPCEADRYAKVDVIALGAGGLSRLGNLVWENTGNLDRYIEGSSDAECITSRIGEVDDESERLRALFDCLYRLDTVPCGALDNARGGQVEPKFLQEGLLEKADAPSGHGVRLSAAGRLRYQDVFARIAGF